jgi:predicted ATPase
VPRYVLTGAPGAGKTAILRALEQAGHLVVEEAATDVIALQQSLGSAEPWTSPGFADAIVTLQRQREARISDGDGTCAIFVDRSPVCTLALARHLGSPVSPLLRAEVDRVVAERVYAAVFFVRNLGFIEPTAARRISFDDSLAFESLHERVYRELGFELIEVPAGPLLRRAALVCAAVGLPVPDFGSPSRDSDSLTVRQRHQCR